MELEALRLGFILNELGRQKNIDPGIAYIEFGADMCALSDNGAMMEVVPNRLDRIGGRRPDAPFAEVFNNSISPVVGIVIEADWEQSATVPSVTASLTGIP